MCQKRYFFFKSTLVISVVCIIICSKIINETVTWESWLTMRLLHESCMGYLKWLFASPSFFFMQNASHVSLCLILLVIFTVFTSDPFLFFSFFFSIRKEKLIHLHMSLFFIFYNLSNSLFFSFCWIIIFIVIILHVYICICVSN